MDAGYFKGTTTDQDNRFIDKNKKLMKTMKFAEGIEKKIDMTKVDMEIIRPWINNTITSYLGYEDDVVVEFTCSQLEQSVDSKQMQVNLTGFLGAKNTREFMEKLWSLLLSAMEDIYGIPEDLKEQKKEQLRIKQAEQERISEAQKNQQLILQEAIAKIKNNAALKGDRNSSPKLSSRRRVSKSKSRSTSHADEPSSVKRESIEVKGSAETRSKFPDRHSEENTAMKDEKNSSPSKRGGDRSKWRFPHLAYGRNRMRSRSSPNYRKKSAERTPDSERRTDRSVSPHYPRNDVDREQCPRSPQRRRSPNRDRNESQSWHNTRRNSRGREVDTVDIKHKYVDRHHKIRQPSRASSTENLREGRFVEKSMIGQDRRYRSHHDRALSPDINASSHSRDRRYVSKERLDSLERVVDTREYSPHTRTSLRISSSSGRHFGHSRQDEIYPDDEPDYLSLRHTSDAAHSRSERLAPSFGRERNSRDSRWLDPGGRLDREPFYDFDATDRRTPVESRRRDDVLHFNESYSPSSKHRSRYGREYGDRAEHWRESPVPEEEVITSEVRRRYQHAMQELYGSGRRGRHRSDERREFYDTRYDRSSYKRAASPGNGNDVLMSDRREWPSSSSRPLRSDHPSAARRSSRYDDRLNDCDRNSFDPRLDRREMPRIDDSKWRDGYDSRDVRRDDRIDQYENRRTDHRSNKNLDRWEVPDVRHADGFDVGSGGRHVGSYRSDEHLKEYVHDKSRPWQRTRSPRATGHDEWISEDEKRVLPRTSRRNCDDPISPYPRSTKQEFGEDRTGQYDLERQRKYRISQDRDLRKRSRSAARSISRGSRGANSPNGSGRFKSDGAVKWRSGYQKSDQDERGSRHEDDGSRSYGSRSSNSPVLKKVKLDNSSKDADEDDEEDNSAEVSKLDESDEKIRKKKKKKKEKKKKHKREKKHKKHKHKKSEDDDNSDHESHDEEANSRSRDSD